MLRRAAVFMLGMLALAPKAAIGGEIDPDHFGTWAPVGKSCKSEPKIVVSATEIVIHHKGRGQRFGDLDESYDCYSGASIHSIPVITRCVYPGPGGRIGYPFILILNPQEKRGVMRFKLEDGNQDQLPTHDQLFWLCPQRKK